MTEFGGIDPATKSQLSDKYREAIRWNVDAILNGNIAVVDPSSGGSSLPTIALMSSGRIESVEEIPVSPIYRSSGKYIFQRLYEIGVHLRTVYPQQFDMLAVELIYYRPSPTTNLRAFQMVNYSVGAIECSLDANSRIFIPPWDWRVHAPDGYTKTDSGDVRFMCQALVSDATALAGERKGRGYAGK